MPTVKSGWKKTGWLSVYLPRRITSGFFMQKARIMKEVFRLAGLGSGRTSPNPMVGAVVVSRGRIVGRGHHEKAGLPHAEVAAIRNAGRMTVGATLYANLEPCCHFGKTPPCTEAIIRSGINKVIYSINDPNPKVNGKGRKHLEEASIEVQFGLLKTEATRLNEAYLKKIRTGFPQVSVLIEQTIDGKIPPKERAGTEFTYPGIEADAIATVHNSGIRIQTQLSRKRFTLPANGLSKGKIGAQAFMRKLARHGLNSVLLIGGVLGGSLIKYGLVDRIHVVIHPFISGEFSAITENLGVRKISDAIPVSGLALKRNSNSIILSGTVN